MAQQLVNFAETLFEVSESTTRWIFEGQKDTGLLHVQHTCHELHIGLTLFEASESITRWIFQGQKDMD